MNKKLRKWVPAALLLLVAAGGGLAAVHFRVELWAIITQQAARDQFINWVQSKGALGVLTFLALQILQIVVAVLPGEPVELMAGVLFGPWGGLAVCLAGVLLGSSFIYASMKLLGAKALPAEALKKYRFLQDEARARSAIYLLFFLPGTPKDMLTYIGPFLPIPPQEFFLICTVARIPSILTSTIAGNSLADGTLWLPILIFAVTGAAGLLAIRYEERILQWMRHKKETMKTKK